MAWNEEIWKAVQKVRLSKENPIEAFEELIDWVELPDDKYFRKFKKATKIWLNLFK